MIPDVCPVCGAKTEREKDTADIKCTSPNCPAQLERHIINFVGRDAMDIKGFGTVYIEELVRLGYIKDIADIFELKDHREELIEQGIIGKEKNTDKLLETIEKAKENDVPFYQDNKLAETLSKLQIGDTIPPELYDVVAEILVFVDDMDKMKAKLSRAGLL